jgi:hypothetical protein
MPYNSRWLVEDRVIYVVYYGVVSNEDLETSSRSSSRMIADGSAPVHLVTDATDMEKMTLGLQDLITIFKGLPSDPNLGWSIFISPSKLNRFFASVTTQLTGARTREFATLEEGIDFLTWVDDSLPDIVIPGR